MPRYAVKLLFQWNPGPDGRSRRRRLCEESIRVFSARSAREALAKAKRLGRQNEFRYTYTAAAGPARYQFVGMLQLLELGVECEKNEVWWELSERLLPLERKTKILPPEPELWALADATRHTHPVRRGRAERRRLTSA